MKNSADLGGYQGDNTLLVLQISSYPTLLRSYLDNKDSKLRNLLPPQNAKHYNLRKGRQFNPVFKTNRFRNSFIVFNALKVAQNSFQYFPRRRF